LVAISLSLFEVLLFAQAICSADWNRLGTEQFHFSSEPSAKWMVCWLWCKKLHLLVTADRHCCRENWRRLIACDLKRPLSGGVVKAVSHVLVKASQRVISRFPIGESIFAKQLALAIRIIP
jgi:hypothetical protein